MEAILESLSGLDNFALYFVISIAFLFIFKIVYAFVTPHDEWKLVKEDKNVAAAVGFGEPGWGGSFWGAGAGTYGFDASGQ